jgi:hypothetical protein
MADVTPRVSAILKGAPLVAALTDTEIESLAARTGNYLARYKLVCSGALTAALQQD